MFVWEGEDGMRVHAEASGVGEGDFFFFNAEAGMGDGVARGGLGMV